MANYLTNDTDLTSVAVAIRNKAGGSEKLVFPNGFVNAINGIKLMKEEETFDVIPKATSQEVRPSTNKVFSMGIVQAIPYTKTENDKDGYTITIA